MVFVSFFLGIFQKNLQKSKNSTKKGDLGRHMRMSDLFLNFGYTNGNISSNRTPVFRWNDFCVVTIFFIEE